MTFKIRILVIILSFLIIQFGFSQTSENQIDSLFLKWNNENHPGGTVGVMKDGNILFLKAYGLASLDYQIPNNKSTIFNVGSVSKQFTAMGIVLLHQQGKLSLDDEIDKFLPELPKFKYPITIRHLLHHTSGLRSLHDLLGLAGWRGDDYKTNADLMRFIKNQKDLNFNPGEAFSYCNTGYVLLAEIIQKATGVEFKQWMKENIFQPLGMTSTYVEDNRQSIVLNNATSYYHSHEDVYERALGYWEYTGAGNIHSTASDLLIWTKNFYAPNRKWQDAFKLLETLDVLNNGSLNNYAFGLFIDEKFGQKRIQHAGVVGGYRSFVSIYPEEKLNIVVLTNFSNAPFGELADKIAEMLLENKTEQTEESNEKVNFKEIETEIPKNNSVYTGTYYSPELETQYRIFIEDGHLKWHHARHGDFDIKIISKDKLKGTWPFEEVKVSRNKRGQINGIYVSNGRVINLWFEKLK